MSEGTGVVGLHAVVTGGGRGIGAAVAAQLTAEGARVTVLGRSESHLAAVVAQGYAAAYAAVDVTDEAAITAALAKAAEAQPLSILVNNAGAAFSAPFAKTDSAAFRAMLDVNLMGAVHGTRAVVPAMQKAGFGRIVNVASTAALKGYPYVSAYVTAKHALLGFTRALALETAKAGITVNAVCPGFTETELVAASVETIVKKTGRDEAAAKADLACNNPQARLLQPAEIAGAIVYLCRREAGGISGTSLTVAGGEIG